MDNLMRRWIAAYKLDEELWKEGQEAGYQWAPVRRPEENLDDPHWRSRKTFTEVYHEDLDKTLTYIGAPWIAEGSPWREGPGAPHLGEHTHEVLAEELGMSTEEVGKLRDSGLV